MNQFLIILLSFSISLQTTASVDESYFQSNDIAEHDLYDDIDEKKKMITEIVDSYRPAIVSRYGQDVKLSFYSLDVFQMLGGHNSSGQLVIEVFAKALEKFNSLSIVAAICHELGHILGDVSNKLAGNNSFNPLDSVEGEADYFSGSCARKYFSNKFIENSTNSNYCLRNDQGCIQAVAGARHTLLAIYNKDIDERDSESEIYLSSYGINPSYPKPSCRLLSILSGITNQPRPRCWYNP